MKHFTQATANGLCTPPCGSSQGKSTRFFFLSLLLGLLTLGSTSAWASTNYFTPGSRIYIHQTDRMLNWGDQMGVIFFYQDEPTKAYGCDCTSEYDKTGVGKNYNSSAAQFCTKISNGYWYFDVPTPDGDKHIGYFRVLKLESSYWCHQQMLICSADEFSGNQNCVTYSQYEVSDNETPTLSEYNNGACVINDNSGSSGGGGGDPEPEPQYDYTFTQGQTIYFDLRDAAWYTAGACLFAEFFTESTSRGESSQLSETGTSHVYSFQIPNRNDITKIVINRYNNSGKQSKWGYTADMTAEAAGSNNCIYMPSWTGDPVSCSWTKFSPYSLIGDYWLKNTKNDAGWLSSGDGPRFSYNGNGIYTLSYLVNIQAPRFTFVEHSTETTDDKRDDTNSTSGFYNNYGSKKYKFNKIAAGTKKVTLTYTSSTDKLAAVYENYDEKYTGWKLFVDGESALDMSDNGEKMVYLASGDHTFYITDGSATTYYGVNKFGGMYLSTSYTNHGITITFPSQLYYDSNVSGDPKFNISSTGYPTYPIAGLRDPAAKFSLSAAANVTFSFDGGTITLDAVAPAAPHTVTIYPNNGSSNFTMEVPDGNSISSISASYGQGTAKWYIDNDPNQEFILGTSTVDDDIDLYAKWGVEGNYYFVSCLQTASDAGGSGNWANGLSRQMTYESGSSGKCSFSFIAPSGHMPFEIIKNQSWGEKINGGTYSGMFDNANSDVTISATGGHFDFTLDAPKKVTVSYDGKVTVKVEDYTFDNSQTYHIKTSWGNGGAAWNYNTTMTNNGTTNATAILRNVPAGNNSFIISTKTGDNDAYAKVGTRTFHALYVDMSSPSLGLSWNTTSARRDGSDNFNSISPQADGHYYRNCSFNLSAVSDIRITFDGGKIRCDILPKYTVSFNSNGGSEVASQSVFEGAQASEPSAPTKAGYEFVKWQLSGSDYSFSSAVTGNITLDAVWAYKAISSVELNESAHTTWLDNSDFVLTPTMTPSDLITKKVEWSSDAEGVASVSNGTVHAAGVGTATITCTVTDMFDHVESASCEVSVAACEMTTDNLYSMTVTGYNSSTGSSATLNGLWNESSDNTEPATFRIVKLRFQPNGNYISNQNPYAADVNGVLTGIAATNDGSDQWYEIPAGSGNYNTTLYYLKNVKTNRYIVRGSTFHNTGNGEWYYYNVNTEAENPENGNSKWFYDTSTGNTRLICYQGYAGTVAATANDQSGNGAFMIHNGNWNAPGVAPNCAPPALMCGFVTSGNFGNVYTTVRGAEVVDASYANPNYTLSLMNSSYYRMKENATVRANLANGLEYGSVITVRLYADAATTVQLTKADGTEIETINLIADAERVYTYTVAYGSELVGATAFIIKAADNHAGIASIEVSRTHAASPDDPALTWDADLSSGVTQSALAGTFQHVASSARSEGAIHYSSSDETVATVAADGTVTPLKAGSTTITATIEAEGCYAEASIPYGVTLTEPTLAELIAADAGEGITLTRNYAEDIVIDKAITIDGGGHTIGNLTVEMAGDLNLTGALTVNDFSIYGQAGNSSVHATSGQVRNANNLTANGNAYFYYTIEPGEHVQHGWYDFTVPFPVNTGSGIKGIQDAVLKADFAYGTDYAIIEHLGDKQAAGEYAYKKFQGVMQPCRLYSITLDDDFNYKTLRFQKTNDGALVAADAVTLNANDGGNAETANWNGVGNGTLHHANVGVSAEVIQVYQSGNNSFKAVTASSTSLAIGTAFMVQEAGTMTLGQATNALLAPRRAASVQQLTAIQIAGEGQPFSDQLFISADEMAGQGYTQGVDVAKAGSLGSAKVPQIWTNAYNNALCAHEARLINGQARFDLSLYAPADGSYTLISSSIPEDKTLYLTYNGKAIWNLSVGETYTLDLNQGTTTEYGLLLVENYKMPTAVENIGSKADETQKIMHNGILYILRNGKVFNAQGARVE